MKVETAVAAINEVRKAGKADGAEKVLPAEKQAGPVAVAPAPRPPAPPPGRELREMQAQIAEQLNRYLKDSGRSLEFRVDADAGATVITVRRADTGEVVRQFPSEEALSLMRRLNEQSGTFLDVTA